MSAIANSNQTEDKLKTSQVLSCQRIVYWKKFATLLIAIALCFSLTACGGKGKSAASNATSKQAETNSISEVSPPSEIQRLSKFLDRYEPQVSIVSPKPEEVLNDTQVAVKFDVKNLPIFKNADFGLGPHIHVTLDNQEYKALYDLNQTATFDHLSAGTHTIRAFASRPWHESFKNQGAYAQVTFNVLTKTGENTPEAKTPLITYSRPVGTYGAEPIMLDFYLQNAPLHLITRNDQVINDWQVRATVDGQSFTFDRWEPIYLKGFKQGKNWVKLELLEDDGDAIANVFNSTAHLIDFQPNGTDTLARLVRDEKIANIEAIVNPDYVAPAPVIIPVPVEQIKVNPEPNPTEKPTETSKAVVPVAPVKTAPIKAVPEAIAPVKEPVQVKVAPVVEPVKAIAPKVTPPKAANSTKDYLKNYSFSPRKVSPPKPEVIKPVEKTEVKAPEPETKPESKSTENSPSLTNLSTTTSTPIKVLIKSDK